MKKNISFLILLQVLILFSCSKDDDVYQTNIMSDSLIGTWIPYGWNYVQVFHFRENSKIEYIYNYTDNYDASIEETGYWNLKGDVLTITLNRNQESITYTQKVIFKDDNNIKFAPISGNNQRYFKGTYYKLRHLNY